MSSSVQGLFRSTGKRARPAAVQCELTGEVKRVDQLPREKLDFYPKPPETRKADQQAAHAANLARHIGPD